MTQVVVIEDEATVREVVKFHLARAGFEVQAFPDVASGWDALESTDLLVLDWMLPGESGISALRRIRSVSTLVKLPVLMLTARAGEVDRVDGLESGADDYLTKPFSAAELVARVRAILRRSGVEERGGILQNGPLSIDLDAAQVLLLEKRLDLTRREFDLLAFLTRNLGRVYSRSELLDKVWGQDFLGGERTVDQHITQLRAHLDEDLTSPHFIETVRGKGYRMRAFGEG
jgi:DNA-binding response OmpR family regulator